MPPTPQVVEAKPLPVPTIENPPDIETPMPVVVLPSTMPEKPEIRVQETKPVPVRKPPVATPTVQTPPPVETPPTTPVVPPPPPAPQLGEILTDDRRREIEGDFTASVARARAAVNRANGRRLNATQRETVGRIRVFLQQAESSRAKDLATALLLAHRADLLGQDLMKSLQ